MALVQLFRECFKTFINKRLFPGVTHVCSPKRGAFDSKTGLESLDHRYGVLFRGTGLLLNLYIRPVVSICAIF